KKIKVSKLLVDELDSNGSSSFLPHFLEYDSVLYEDFSEVDTLTSTDNEDKIFNPGILVHENLYEVTNQVTPDKNIKKKSSSNASLILEDYNPPLSDHELPFHIEIPGSGTLLSFSSENEEKVFNLGILISKGVHSLLPKLSHWDSKAFKVVNIFETQWRFFLALIERTSVFWMFHVSIFIPHVGSLDHSMDEAQDQWQYERLNIKELLIKNKELLQTLKMKNNNEVANLILTNTRS
ncbi:hypothetical protein Tco_1478423, partial [Tanacetum coccineum]